ncbi:MAG: bacillithiol system redox-active protein YtxJ [Saprospiraceae bacterium]|jgi:bacillithiol system protein YtxJ|nr:bacillithiol system redox-active protein YtxJ [Saprospiraceae bacterium]
MDWKPLTNLQELNEVIDRSKQVPCLIFKHSTRCSISFMAKHRLEAQWDFNATEIEPYYLDLISYRNVSNEIAERFQVYHESPQILLIKDGDCYHDASHLDISVEEIKEVL